MYGSAMEKSKVSRKVIFVFFIDRAAHFYDGVMCKPTVKDSHLELDYIENR